MDQGGFKVRLDTRWFLPKNEKSSDNDRRTFKETLLLVIYQKWIFPQIFVELPLYLKFITSERNLNILVLKFISPCFVSTFPKQNFDVIIKC